MFFPKYGKITNNVLYYRFRQFKTEFFSGSLATVLSLSIQSQNRKMLINIGSGNEYRPFNLMLIDLIPKTEPHNIPKKPFSYFDFGHLVVLRQCLYGPKMTGNLATTVFQNRCCVPISSQNTANSCNFHLSCCYINSKAVSVIKLCL